MKKLSLILAVLLLVPAMAAVNVTVTDNDGAGAGLVGTVNYAADANVSAFALTLSVNNGAKITAFTPTRVGESIATAKGYGIFPGSIDINDTTGDVNEYGTPVVGTLPTAADGSIIIEMGALYGPGDANRPLTTGTLGTITVDKACHVSVALEPVRGGIVYTTAAPATLGTSGGDIQAAPPVCKGDANVDGKVSTGDLSAIVAFLSPAYAGTTPPYTCTPIPAGKEGMDANGDGKISTADLSAIVAFLSPAYAGTTPPYTYIGCMP